MRIENEHSIGDRVYLYTDRDQFERIVTGIMIRPGGNLLYELSCSDEGASEHYGFEIITEPRVF